MTIEKYGHGGDIWTAAETWGISSETLLDLSANINPLGPPESIWQAIREGMEAITAYPDPKARELRGVLAEHVGQPAERLLVGNGAAEILYGIMRALRPRTVGVVQPCFSEYAEAAEVVEAELCELVAREADDFCPERAELLALCERVDLLVLGYPNNPNGLVLPAEWLVECAAVLARQSAWLLVDEAFLDFLPGMASLACQLEELPNVLIMRSMTKFYSIPGLRLGYLIALPETVAQVERELPPWGVNALAQAAGIAGVRDDDFAKRSWAWLTEERPYLAAGLSALPGVKTYPGEVNYVLFRCEVPQLQERLGRRGILIRSCAAYPGLGPAYYRVAVRGRDENERLLAALRDVIEEA